MSGKDYTEKIQEDRGLLERIMGYIPGYRGYKEKQNLSIEDAHRFDSFTYRLDRVTQRVDRAVAGYAGMFDAVRVREDKLNGVIQYDLNMIEKADSIKEDVQKVVSLQPGADDWGVAMDAVISKVDEFDRFIDDRANVLRGLQG
jgi:hypothetical protein